MEFENQNEVSNNREVIEKIDEKDFIVKGNKFSDTQLLVMELENQLKPSSENEELNRAEDNRQILETSTTPSPKTSISVSTPTLTSTSSSSSTSTLINDKKSDKNVFSIFK